MALGTQACCVFVTWLLLLHLHLPAGIFWLEYAKRSPTSWYLLSIIVCRDIEILEYADEGAEELAA